MAAREMMSNHNRCWIWGRNAVLETLRGRYWPVLELLVSERADSVVREEILQLAAERQFKTTLLSDVDLAKRCRADDHQGFAARMPPFPYQHIAELLNTLPPNPAVVMLDRIHDSYNFGAIIRSAEVLGIDGIIVGKREQAQVNSLVARSSAGAVNYVPIAQSEEPAATIGEFLDRGFQIVGTSDRANQSIFDIDFKRSTLLLIGNEGRGIQPELESLCTQFVQIPVLGHVSSLNAAVAAGILFYELRRQRQDHAPN